MEQGHHSSVFATCLIGVSPMKIQYAPNYDNRIYSLYTKSSLKLYQRKKESKIEKQKLSRRGYRCPLSSGRRGPHSKTYITSRGDTNESVKGKKPSRYALEGLNPRESEPSTRSWPKKKDLSTFPLGWELGCSTLPRVSTGISPPAPHPRPPHPSPFAHPPHLTQHASLRFIIKKLIPWTFSEVNKNNFSIGLMRCERETQSDRWEDCEKTPALACDLCSLTIQSHS